MQFHPFRSNRQALDVEGIQGLLFQLLYHQAPLQLSPNQKVWDQTIPIYNIDIEGPFDDSKVANLLTQVKNKGNGTLLDVNENRGTFRRLFGEI